MKNAGKASVPRGITLLETKTGYLEDELSHTDALDIAVLLTSGFSRERLKKAFEMHKKNQVSLPDMQNSFRDRYESMEETEQTIWSIIVYILLNEIVISSGWGYAPEDEPDEEEEWPMHIYAGLDDDHPEVTGIKDHFVEPSLGFERIGSARSLVGLDDILNLEMLIGDNAAEKVKQAFIEFDGSTKEFFDSVEKRKQEQSSTE